MSHIYSQNAQERKRQQLEKALTSLRPIFEGLADHELKIALEKTNLNVEAAAEFLLQQQQAITNKETSEQSLSIKTNEIPQSQPKSQTKVKKRIDKTVSPLLADSTEYSNGTKKGWSAVARQIHPTIETPSFSYQPKYVHRNTQNRATYDHSLIPITTENGDQLTSFSKKGNFAHFVQEMFPHVNVETIYEAYRDVNGDAQAAIELILEKLNSCNGEQYLHYTPHTSTNEDQSSDEDNAPTNNTDTSTEDLYYKYRRDAIWVTRKRNKLFRSAAAAYQRGDKASAHEFAEQGKEKRNEAIRLHSEASNKIFAELNDCLHDIGVIDLHGQHFDEALTFLKERLMLLKQLKKVEVEQNTLSVITGIGNHSQGRAILQPMIKAYLNENGYNYSERAGLLIVKVKY